ncbi:exocyst complex component exo70 [Claviceps aff. humidiphila group G2b]|nr:exocyst complex component exo70 [Claviceps aff. humidiphila group G2b]
MAVSLLNAAHHASDEEARAEVDVLNSRLDKTTQLTKKIQASLEKLEASGQSVRDVAGPISGETRRLQLLGNNVISVLAAIDRLRKPADSKDSEEQIIRAGPEKAGLSSYLGSLKRLNRSYADMQASNLRANQHTMSDLIRLMQSGSAQLEIYFDKLLRGETPRSIEPLHYITKEKPFPVLPQDKIARLGLVYAYFAGVQQADESAASKIFAEIRGPYLSSSLANLAAASVNTAKKKNTDAIYRAGTNGISTYAQAMEAIFLSEYDNICSIFRREDWGSVFQATCRGAVSELARTVRELNSHIKSHLNTDCYLAYEIIEIISGLSVSLDTRTGELKDSLAAALKPVRETAKSLLSELLEDTRKKAAALQTLPSDGAYPPLVVEMMQRLQTMVEFLRPISSIMISLGDGGWRSNLGSVGGGPTDAIPSLASFDIGADGKDIFAHYCIDSIDALLVALDQKAKVLLRGKSVAGVFIANCVVVIERGIRDSDLGPLLQSRSDVLDQWHKKATAAYTDVCRDLSVYLFDTIHTNRTQRPTSGQADSATVVKGLSSKDKDKIKEKFTQFNVAFDDMVAKHKSYCMEPEVRSMFGRDIRQKLQPLYDRFWDRYHEIDKGKGKYVKYDKASIAAVFLSLA